MTCPSCNREYERQAFTDEQRFFYCVDCKVELVLSSSERLDELRRHGRMGNIRSVETGADVSTVPLTLWLIALILLSVGSIVRGTIDITRGESGPGVETLLTALPLLVATFVGSLRRRKWGLYLTYTVLALQLARVGSGFIRDESERFGERLGAWTANVVIGGILVSWGVWFVRHRELFSTHRALPTIVDDVYSSPRGKNDV